PFWHIETSAFLIPMPAGFRLRSPDDPGDSKPFYLISEDGVDIFPQGPVRNDRVPSTERLVAPGQRLVGERTVGGVTLVEVAYEPGGRAWGQSPPRVRVGRDRPLVSPARPPAARAAPARHTVADLLGIPPFD